MLLAGLALTGFRPKNQKKKNFLPHSITSTFPQLQTPLLSLIALICIEYGNSARIPYSLRWITQVVPRVLL
jgi:hypothetical protein